MEQTGVEAQAPRRSRPLVGSSCLTSLPRARMDRLARRAPEKIGGIALARRRTRSRTSSTESRVTPGEHRAVVASLDQRLKRFRSGRKLISYGESGRFAGDLCDWLDDVGPRGRLPALARRARPRRRARPAAARAPLRLVLRRPPLARRAPREGRTPFAGSCLLPRPRRSDPRRGSERRVPIRRGLRRSLVVPRWERGRLPGRPHTRRLPLAAP